MKVKVTNNIKGKQYSSQFDWKTERTRILS